MRPSSHEESQLSDLKQDSSDMVYEDDVSARHTVEGLAINVLCEAGVSERFTSFVIVLVIVLLRVAGRGNRRTAFQLFALQTYTSFKMNMFKRYIKSGAYCEELTAINRKGLTIDDGFRRFLVLKALQRMVPHTIRDGHDPEP